MRNGVVIEMAILFLLFGFVQMQEIRAQMCRCLGRGTGKEGVFQPAGFWTQRKARNVFEAGHVRLIAPSATIQNDRAAWKYN